MMEDKLIETVRKYDMLQEGSSVLVGLSGGADSVSLLHALCSLREQMRLKVYACHVHHGLRGAEADRDEAFCAELCRKWNVPYEVLHCDIAKEAEKRKIGTEECGRDVRYAFFEKLAEQYDAKIATAHTASDNAETILFHLTRGCGLIGLCGIPPVRGKIIRPLIEISRQEIEDYCRTHGLLYVTDSSNLGRDYSRNRIRLDVLPPLKEINPSLDRTLTRFSERMRQTEAYIIQEAKNALKSAEVRGGYDAGKMRQWHEVVFFAAVRILCEEFAVIPEAKHIELIKKIVYNSGAVDISGRVRAVMTQGIFRICEVRDAAAECEEYPIGTAENMCIAHKKLTYRVMNIDEYHDELKKYQFSLANSLDYGTIPLTSVFRLKKSGDRITLPYRGVTKPLRKVFNEIKLPQEKRDSVLVLADESRVLWSEEIGACKECMVTQSTEKVLVIEVEMTNKC